MKENMEISAELINEIYKEIKETKEVVLANSVEPIREEIKLMEERFNVRIDEMDERINDRIDEMDARINSKTDGIDEKINGRMDGLDEKINNLAKTEKMHFEFTKNNFERIDKKIDSNFAYLDSKIENTKDALVSDIVDLFDSFSSTTSNLIGNLEKKIDTEMRERKSDISKVKGLNEYDKIILKDLESRISILEEESQPYKVN